ncbi:MAG: substrate-binding domain-containing protein [Bdellovibrionales bacterium]|nr:substrate-binding domain-containing protein [Bdellovibrionales bacterium]
MMTLTPTFMSLCRQSRGVVAVGALCLVLLLSSAARAEGELGAVLPEYQPAKLPSGTLSSVGSDSMGGLVRVWVDAYGKLQPNVKMAMVSRGSAMAPAALIEGTADLGPMARPMKQAEREDFIAKYGFEPTQVRSALAAVSIFVHEENPIEEISFGELDRAFSVERRRGDEASPRLWSNLGVSGSFSNVAIELLGREQNSSPAAYFKQRVLLQGAFVPQLMTTASLDSLLEAVTLNRGALAFGEFVSVVPPGVKVLAVSKEPGERAYAPTVDTVVDGRYPLARFLNIYVVRTPGEPLDDSVKDFLRFVLSRQGQQLVRQEGMIALPPEVVAEELAKLQ